MPILVITNKEDGTVRRVPISGDKRPTDEELRGHVSGQFFQEESPVQAVPDTLGNGGGSTPTIAMSLAKEATKAAQSFFERNIPPEELARRESAESALDIREARERPTILGGVGRGLTGAGGELLDIAKLVGKGVAGAFSPIDSARAIGAAAKKLSVEGVVDFTKDTLKDSLTSVGIDLDRPGVGFDKFDADVLVDKWTNRPISAIGDFALFNAPLKAPAAIKKITQMKLLKRSGKQMAEMTDDIVEATARAKSIDRIVAKDLLSPGQQVTLRADVIAKMTSDQLKSIDFVKDTSVKLSKDILRVGDLEAAKMNEALRKFAAVEIDSAKLSSSIKTKLIDEGVATQLAGAGKVALKEAVAGAKGAPSGVNVIKAGNKKSILKFLEDIDANKTMTVKELKRTMDAIDDSINWAVVKESDKGLRVMRKEIRNELGRIVPDYGEIATGIHERLVEFGYVEKKLRKGKSNGFLRKYHEDMALEIARSPERRKAFEAALKGIDPGLRGAAKGKFELVDGWRVWNELYDENQNFFKFRGDEKGMLADSFIKGGQKAVRLEFPTLPDKVSRAADVAGGASRGLVFGGLRRIPAAAKGAAVTQALTDN